MLDFIDWEVVNSPGFVILSILAVGATILGYILGSKWDLPSFSFVQLIIIILGELIACYYFASRG